MNKFRGSVVFGLLMLLVLMLTACADDALTNPPLKPEVVAAFKSEPSENKGDAVAGEKIFNALPCQTCHVLNGSGGTQANAPILDGIATKAATRIDGVTATQYLRHALIKPQDLQVTGYRNIMPGFAQTLTDRDPANPTKPLEDLIAYLLTLK